MSDAPDAVDTSDWDRLPKRMVFVQLARLALSLLPAALVFVFLGELPGLGLLLGLVAAMSIGAVRDLTNVIVTRYRVDDARVQLRTGVFTTSHLSIPRDRVRAVDVTARPLHRLVGLATVRVGTGEQVRSGAGGELTLDAIDAAAADRLRAQLLAAAREVEGEDGSPAETTPSAPAATTLSHLRWHWLGWSLLSWWTLLLPGIVLGSGYQLLASLGLDPDRLDLVSAATDLVRSASIALLVGAVVAGVLLVGVVARTATFVETWWGFQLQREADGTLRVQRGLLTSRSTSLQEERIRGVQLSEPLLLRPFEVGSAQVVTTGVAQDSGGATESGSTTLGPAARLREVDEVVAAVLREPTSPVRGQALQRHPRAALRRRAFRAATLTALAWAGLSVTAVAVQPSRLLLVLLVAAGAVIAAGAAAVALDSWRSLGHGLAPRHVVMRRGVLLRRTVALECDGVVGWIGTRTWFQRRVGLMTLTATSAAGASAYAIVDVDQARGIGVADAAIPGLLTPFLTTQRAASSSANDVISMRSTTAMNR